MHKSSRKDTIHDVRLWHLYRENPGAEFALSNRAIRAMAKAKVTRTFGPIHFEDMDPHRFEDLIRELIYDFRDWQSIEATGRSGSDDGFDIRAYEKIEASVATVDEGEEIEVRHPMEGNQWMIQGKREKEIGPAKLK